MMMIEFLFKRGNEKINIKGNLLKAPNLFSFKKGKIYLICK